MIIDSHCHLHDEKYAVDLDQVLERAKAANVSHLITIGCDVTTTKNAQKIAHKFHHVFYTAGFHPHEARHLDDTNYRDLRALAGDKKCIAIGECGLDYYYLHSSKDEQKKALIRQLELAEELNLPVVIHLRDAFEDLLSILENNKNKALRMVIHCFSGTLKEALIFQDMGCFISLSGIITFKKPGELLLVAKTISLNRLLLETDCPYLAPHPYRGQRNEPGYIVHTLDAVAKARNDNRALIEEQIYENTLAFFGLKISSAS